MASRGKYRYRTLLREHLPEFLAARVPKGREDCGAHEWYVSDESTWRCYHCRAGVTHEVPWADAELAARRHAAGELLSRAGTRLPDQQPTPGH
jgi:hypothetical protein